MRHKRQPQASAKGFTLMEALMAMVLIAITATTFMMIQNRTWQRTRTSTRMMKAGNMIEQYIEKLRMAIAHNPDSNFPPRDTTVQDGLYTLNRSIATAYSPSDNSVIANVRKLTMTVLWGTGKNDTLKVVTYIAKDF